MLAITVFAFAAGSSIEYRVLRYARQYRWVCLFVLLGLALAYAGAMWWRRRPKQLPWTFLVLAAAFVMLGLASAVWSVDASLTLRRAGSFGVLLAAAALLLAATSGRPDGARRLLTGLLVGAVAVGIAGLFVLALDYDAAIQPASPQYPARFQGFEQNPDTAALLFALAIPIATYLMLATRPLLVRIVLGATLLLFVGSLAGSGSRGPMLAAFAGALVVVLSAASGRNRVVLAVVAFVAFVGCVGISRIPQAKPPPPTTPGGAPPIRRTLFSLSGRRAAWAGAIHQAENRPVAGYGFGTESRVFVDRYASFESDLVENTYIGTALQLGVVGLALLCAVVGAAVGVFARAPSAGIETGCAGVTAAALVVAATQSYLLSVGNIGTATAWVSLFLLAGLRAVPAAQSAVAASSERMPSRETASSHSG
jgi:O-antigen ligase